MIRRTDRAVEACTNCAASKAKCEDQKPCSRCRAKNVPCEMPQRKVQKYKTISDGTVHPPKSPPLLGSPFCTDPLSSYPNGLVVEWLGRGTSRCDVIPHAIRRWSRARSRRDQQG